MLVSTKNVAVVKRTLLTVLVAAAFLFAAPRAQAGPKLCIPDAGGVPALGGAPRWWKNTASDTEPQYWPRQDDPRWRGALAKSWGTGAGEHVQFRALRDLDSLYFQWQVKVDPALTPFGDFLTVGISPGGTAKDVLITIYPFTGAGADDEVQAGLAPQIHFRRRTSGATFGAQESPPAWLVNDSPVAGVAGYTRVWLDVDQQEWGVNMRVPISTIAAQGLSLSDTFRMWFQATVSLTTDGSSVEFYRLKDDVPLEKVTCEPCECGSPGCTAADCVSDCERDASAWPEFSRALSASSPECVKGVSISSSNVGTKYTDSGGIPRPNRISLSGTNTFYARPTNDTGAAIGAGQICAQFRIGNWGTQPDWNDVTAPTETLWKLIRYQCPSDQLTNKDEINAGATASDANEIYLDLTLTAAERCEFIGQSGVPAAAAPDHVAIPGDPSCPNANPIRRLHQCMLVELSGGGFTYTPSSVYRNMDFVNASVFERKADVSVAGIKRLAGQTHRRVILYVKTYNMPADINQPSAPSQLRDLEKLLPFLFEKGQRVPSHSMRKDPKSISLWDFWSLSQALPTYVVYAYRDSGRDVNLSGHKVREYDIQSSFGYYVIHEGDLTGYDYSLAGANPVQGSPDHPAGNVYTVDVPDGQSVEVATHIEAREGKPDGAGGSLATTTGYQSTNGTGNTAGTGGCKSGTCCGCMTSTSNDTPWTFGLAGLLVLLLIVRQTQRWKRNGTS